MKAVTRDQALALSRRFSLIDFGKLDHDRIEAVLQLPEDEFVRRATAFVANDCLLTTRGPSTLIVDRSTPFSASEFMGNGWSVVKAEGDSRSRALTEVDFAKVRFESGLREGEAVITGEEKLRRLLATPKIRLDAKVGQTLYEQENQATLRWMYQQYGVTLLEFAGTVLLVSPGHRCFLCLCRASSGVWDWNHLVLPRNRDRSIVSPLLAL